MKFGSSALLRRLVVVVGLQRKGAITAGIIYLILRICMNSGDIPSSH